MSSKKNSKNKKQEQIKEKSKEKINKSLIKVKEDKKEKKPNKFIQLIKKRWLINATDTFLLIGILVMLFILLTNWLHTLKIDPIDFTESKLYSLTDETKERVKNIKDKVNIYFVGMEESSEYVTTGKLYTNVNSNINVEAVNVTERADLVQKYQLGEDSTGIIVECGEKSKILSTSDLYTYDASYNTIDLREGALTAAILTVTSDYIPNVYFLNGYSEYTLSGTLSYLATYLKNEVMNVNNLDILVEGKIPDNCDALVICTPNKDFEDVVADKIIEYINNGGKILWLNGYRADQSDLTNVNKILSIYGVNKFENGVIYEQDSSKMFAGAPYVIIPEIQDTEITKNIANNKGLMLPDAGRINVKSDEELKNINVVKTDLLKSSEKSFYRTNLSNTSTSKADGEETGPFLIGGMFEKTIDSQNTSSEEQKEEKKSTLILIAENYFVSDYSISSSSQAPWIILYNNKDLALNSLAYLSNREQDITIRKSTTEVEYTPTELQDRIIIMTIFAVPIIIILIGIVVWQVRRRKK